MHVHHSPQTYMDSTNKLCQSSCPIATPTPSPKARSVGATCGGIAGLQCGAGEFCFFNDPVCDPSKKGNFDCSGVCQADTCGGFIGAKCPDERYECVLEQECVNNNGADCTGH